MKKYIKYIFSTLFGIYFLFAGSGFNVIRYCCQSCADEGIEAMAATMHKHEVKSCCETMANDQATSAIQQPVECCHIERLAVEVSPIVVASELVHRSVFDLNLFFTENFLNLQDVKLIKHFADSFTPPNHLPCSGRDVLTQKSVLLI